MEITRRSFVAGMGAVAASTSTVATGLAAEAAPAWDEEFDIVVVGAGDAGTCAALTVANEFPGATCLLAEKGAVPGGNSVYSDNAALYTENPDRLFTYFTELSGDFGPGDAVMRAFADGCAENYSWLLSLNPPAERVMIYTPEDWLPEFYEMESGKDCLNLFKIYQDEEKTNNKYLHAWLLEQVEAQDVIEYRTEAEMTELVQDPQTKAILGAVIGGKRVKANKGVILCTGGFENDPELMQCYLGQGHAVPGGGHLNDGVALKACQKVGAQLWHMNNCTGFWMSPTNNDGTIFEVIATQLNRQNIKRHGITVGVNGRRFYMDYDGHNIKDTVDDDKYDQLSTHVGSRHGHMQFGGEWSSLPMPRTAWYVYDQAGMDAGAFSPDAGSTDPVADGWVYTANTIEELEAQLGIPEGELVRSVTLWNDSCAAGEDLYYFRPSDTLTPISTPPYYAQLCRPTFLNTQGGPKRNEKAQVIDLDDQPIPGLYAAGEFGSIFGTHYNGAGNIGECFAFARIAVRSAMSAE